MASLIGKPLSNGKYTLEQELGQGGFGVTYRAINHALRQFVVIKTVNEALRNDPNFANYQRHFQDEARRLARCSHPNIVRVSDFFIEDDLPYIVMDYIPGETLGNLVLANNPLPEALALHYIRQVAEAVRVIHQSGLLHRDVKPQNMILREGSQQVILIDFGIAREFTPGHTQTHTRIASDGYAPIEQYLPQAKRTAAIDVYGLAATLYTLLTAQIPVSAILRDRVPLSPPRDFRPELNAAVNEAVMRGMALEPQHRPATVDEWLMLLPNVVGYEPPGASYASSTSRMATTPVAPVYRQDRASAASVAVPRRAVPRRQQQTNWWLPGLVIVVAIASLSFTLFRLLTAAPPSQPEEPASPTPAATPALPPIQLQPTPTVTPSVEALSPSPTPSLAEPSPPAPSPSPSESPTAEISPSPVEPIAPSPTVTDPAIAPSNPQPPTGSTITEPAPPPPSVEAAPDPLSTGQ